MHPAVFLRQLGLGLMFACSGQNGSGPAVASESEVEVESEADLESEAQAEATDEGPDEIERGADPETEAVASEAGPEAQQAQDGESQTEFVTREMRVDAPSHRTPGAAPHAIVHGTRGAERIVLFLHGWGGCARALAYSGADVPCFEEGPSRAGWALTEVHQAADASSLLIVAQLSWLQRGGNPGRFAEAGFASAWLDSLETPGLPIVIMAHSAGFETTLAILRHGDLGDRVEAVVLYDALYSGTEGFVSWVRGSPTRRLISYYTGSTAGQNRRLRGLAQRHDLALGERIGPEQILSIRTRSPHADVPIAHWGEALATLSAAQ